MLLITAAFFTKYYFVSLKYEFDFISTDSNSDSYENINFAAASPFWAPKHSPLLTRIILFGVWESDTKLPLFRQEYTALALASHH